jgi:hypothetical protein
MRETNATYRFGAFALAVAAFVFQPVSAAHAQPGEAAERQSARTLGYAGIEAYQAGDYVTAEENLSQAFNLMRVPSLGLWSARALVKLGKLVEASERYLVAASIEVPVGDAEIQRTALSEAAREREALLPRIPVLTIRLEGASPPEVEVWLDRRALTTSDIGTSLRVNPGNRLVVGRRGNQQTQVVVKLAEGEQSSALLRFSPRESTLTTLPAAPAGAAPSSAVPARPANVAPRVSVETKPEPARDTNSSASTPLRTAGWALVGLGGTSLVLAGVAGIVANGKRDGFEQACPDHYCPRGVPDDVRDEARTYNTLVTLSTIGWIAGGALAAGGAVLILTEQGPEPQLALGVGPGSATLRGRF